MVIMRGIALNIAMYLSHINQFWHFSPSEEGDLKQGQLKVDWMDVGWLIWLCLMHNRSKKRRFKQHNLVYTLTYLHRSNPLVSKVNCLIALCRLNNKLRFRLTKVGNMKKHLKKANNYGNYIQEYFTVYHNLAQAQVVPVFFSDARHY